MEGCGGLNQQIVGREDFRQSRQGWKEAHLKWRVGGRAHTKRPEKQTTAVVVAAVRCRKQTASGGESRNRLGGSEVL